MSLHMLSQLVQDLQKSIDEAQRIQTAVLRLHAQYGLDPRNPGAALEQPMSREEIAKAQADMHHMEAGKSTADTMSTKPGSQAPESGQHCKPA